MCADRIEVGLVEVAKILCNTQAGSATARAQAWRGTRAQQTALPARRSIKAGCDERWWWLHAACINSSNRDWKANAAGLGAIGKIKRFHQPHVLDMWVAQNLGKIIDWRTGHVTTIHFFKPIGSAAAFENRCQNINKNGLVFRTVGLS